MQNMLYKLNNAVSDPVESCRLLAFLKQLFTSFEWEVRCRRSHQINTRMTAEIIAEQDLRLLLMLVRARNHLHLLHQVCVYNSEPRSSGHIQQSYIPQETAKHLLNVLNLTDREEFEAASTMIADLDLRYFFLLLTVYSAVQASSTSDTCDSAPREDVACGDDTLTISCPEGQKINIMSANYGRTEPDAVRCPFGKTHKDRTDCIGGTSMLVMKDRCQKKESCTVPVTNDVFGDPCGGTYKYLEVTYQCLCQEGNICQNSFGNSCESGWRIVCNTCSDLENDSPLTCSCMCDFEAEPACSPTSSTKPPCSPQPLISGDEYNIPDSDLTASSQWIGPDTVPDVLAPQNSRLNQCPGNVDLACAWEAATRTTGDYIQADLGGLFEVHQVAIQGRGLDQWPANQWVTRFNLALSTDGMSFVDLDNGGEGYEGAYDNTTVVTRDVPPTIARYVRMIVMGFHESPSLRWEVYGCPVEEN